MSSLPVESAIEPGYQCCQAIGKREVLCQGALRVVLPAFIAVAPKPHGTLVLLSFLERAIPLQLE